jgi:hypothetical protein
MKSPERKSSDGLFDLIGSLTRSEKRYFKLFVSLQGGEKNYIRLFDAIDAQEHYDEASLKELFRGEPFIRQLHVVKNYLFRLIMKSLRSYQSESSIDAQIHNLLLESVILHEKGLHRQCRQTLKKARQLATTHERDALMLELMELEERFLPEIGTTPEGVAEHLNEQRSTLRRLGNLYELRGLSNRASIIVLGNGKPREAENQEALQEIMQHPLLSDEGRIASRVALSRFYYIHSSYRYATDDRQGALEFTRRRLRLLESSPETLHANLNEYASVLTNLLVLDKEETAFPELLGRMRAIPGIMKKHRISNDRLRYRIFNFSYGLELAHRVAIGEFERGKELVPAIERGIEEFEEFITKADRLRFWFLLATIDLGLGDLSHALDHINRAIDIGEINSRQQVHFAAKLLELIIHFELGNISLLEYRVKSTYRYLRGRDNLFRFERTVLDYLRRMPDLHDRQEVIASFGDLYNELEPLASMPLERHAFDHFNYLAWLESRMTGRSFPEAIRERRRRESQAIQESAVTAEALDVTAPSNGTSYTMRDSRIDR